MRVLSSIVLQLLRWPYKLRLAIVAVPFIASLVIYAITFKSTQNATVIITPVICAAWLFSYRGTLLCIVTINLAVIIITCILLKGIIWPTPLLITTVIGITALFLISSIISSLRYSLILIEESRLKALQAEQQTAIAYEQRLEALQAQQKMTTAYEQERQLNNLKDQFIMNVSHELRTPLAELYGYLELLIEYNENLDNETRTTFLQKANNGCEELMLLVNSMLESIETGNGVQPPRLEELAIAQIVHEVLPLFDPYKEQDFSIKLEIPEGASVLADRQYLRQILRNLLSNAFKYAPKHTVVTIRAQVLDADSRDSTIAPQLCISVKDEGPGIPPDEMPLLFGKFVRLQRDLSGSVRGTGLGLYISKQLVEAMQGQLTVESAGRMGEGSCFSFTLPIAPSYIKKARWLMVASR